MSEFYKRLEVLMPKKNPPQDSGLAFLPRFEIDHIRMTADAFAHAMDGEIPKDYREMGDLLYVFGNVLDGHLQAILQHMSRLHDDWVRAQPIPPTPDASRGCSHENG